MDPRNQAVAIVLGALLVLAIVELVRRRRLREEYSVLWLLTGAVVAGLAAFPSLLTWITHLIGAEVPVSTLFFFGLLFSLAISLHFSVRISRLHEQVKDLAQQLAVDRADSPRPPGTPEGPPRAGADVRGGA
jgi:hypothetical protein